MQVGTQAIGKTNGKITVQMLQQSTLKSKTVIAGHNLLSMKNDAICNMKVALSKAAKRAS